jgi:hypothetical protein
MDPIIVYMILMTIAVILVDVALNFKLQDLQLNIEELRVRVNIHDDQIRLVTKRRYEEGTLLNKIAALY